LGLFAGIWRVGTAS